MAALDTHPTVDAVFDRLQAYVDESDRSSPPVFVGREDELAALHRAVDRVATTNPRSMTKLVQGIAGAGKTSLCHEFIDQINGEYVNGHPIVAIKLAPSDLGLNPLALVAKLTTQMPARMDVMPGKSRFMSAVRDIRREASHARTAALMLTPSKPGYELTNKEHGLSNRSDLGTCIDVYARGMWAKDVVVVLAVDEMQNCPVTEASRSNLLVLNECLHDGRIFLVGFGLQNTARKVREELGLSRLSRGAEIEVGPLRAGEGRTVVESTFESLGVTTQSTAWSAYLHEAGFTTPSWSAWRDSLVNEIVVRCDDFPHHLTNGVLATCETLLANRSTFSPSNNCLGHIIDLLDSAKEDYYEQRLGNDLPWHTTALGGLCKKARHLADDKVLESDVSKALAIGVTRGAPPTGADVVSLIELAEDRGILQRRTFGGEIWYRVSPIPSMASYLANMFDRRLARGDAVALELSEVLEIPTAARMSTLQY